MQPPPLGAFAIWHVPPPVLRGLALLSAMLHVLRLPEVPLALLLCGGHPALQQLFALLPSLLLLVHLAMGCLRLEVKLIEESEAKAAKSSLENKALRSQVLTNRCSC